MLFIRCVCCLLGVIFWIKLVTNTLVYHVSSQDFLHRSLFGFTTGVGTEHTLHELRMTVEVIQNRDNDCFLVMLEVKGTFNKLWWWSSIFDALGRMRCPRNLFNLVKSFLSERKVKYRTEILFLIHEYNVSCPQASNSSPFF